MVFSSLTFIFVFLPIFFLIYFVSPYCLKNTCLLAGSLFFYSYGVMDHPAYMGLFVLSLLVNYRLGALIGRRRRGPVRTYWLACGIVYNLSWLFLFKYSAFFAANINGLLDYAGVHVSLPVNEWQLPVGISFYTFQAISYLVDVYRKGCSLREIMDQLRDVHLHVSPINCGTYRNLYLHPRPAYRTPAQF